MTSTRIVMIMHSIGHTCPFGRDSVILWGEFLIIFAGRTRVMHGLYVCDCGAVADCTGSTVCCDTECIPLSTEAEWRQSAVDYGCVDDMLLLL